MMHNRLLLPRRHSICLLPQVCVRRLYVVSSWNVPWGVKSVFILIDGHTDMLLQQQRSYIALFVRRSEGRCEQYVLFASPTEQCAVLPNCLSPPGVLRRGGDDNAPETRRARQGSGCDQGGSSDGDRRGCE